MGMIDFDPETQEVLMPAEVAMKFMIWAGYYNGLELSPARSFSSYCDSDGVPLFSKADSERLDRVKDVLFKCFDAASVANSMKSISLAKLQGEKCPYSRESLDLLF